MWSCYSFNEYAINFQCVLIRLLFLCQRNDAYCNWYTFNSVSKDLKGAFYSINTMACTFMGNLISPPIYWYLNDKFKDIDKKMPMRCILNYIWVNLVYLIITAIFRYRKKDSESKDVNKQEGRPSKTKAVGDTMNESTGQDSNPVTTALTNDNTNNNKQVELKA